MAPPLESEQELGSVHTIREVDSMVNSQSSSVDETIASQSSRPLPLSQEIRRLPHADPFTGENTPATSFSNPSSQDPPTTEVQPDFRPRPLSSGRQYSRSPPRRSPTLLDDGKIPNKRMANGEVKHVEQTLSSPVEQQGHSRNTSAVSRSSQIGEASLAGFRTQLVKVLTMSKQLSSQLRTRLSYAMVKVQNGWQAHSFDELESLSQQASPISAVSEIRRSFEDSRSNVTDLQLDQSGFPHSSERTSATPENSQSFPHAYNGASALDYHTSQTFNSARSPTITQSGPTYESFWREHSTSNALKYAQPQSPPLGGPSLAPPVDILPRSRRRSNPLRTQPPSLTTNSNTSNNHGSISLASNLTADPATPPKRSSTLRTPSQKAAMEQDAVETLLFMSSPGNSGHQPQTRSVRTPLRSSFTPLEKRVGFADVRSVGIARDEDRHAANPFQAHRSFSKPEGIVNGADVDRLLDEMPDESSSSEEDDLNVPHR